MDVDVDEKATCIGMMQKWQPLTLSNTSALIELNAIAWGFPSPGYIGPCSWSLECHGSALDSITNIGERKGMLPCHLLLVNADTHLLGLPVVISAEVTKCTGVPELQMNSALRSYIRFVTRALRCPALLSCVRLFSRVL
jgi:hypothetical protein